MKNRSPNILITGGHGQVGHALATLTKDSSNIRLFTKHELDITDPIKIEEAINRYQPTTLINTAAFTAVDDAESDIETANHVNHIGALTLAQYCNQLNCRLIHLSTDYVFDGSKTTPYSEDDLPNPINQYGHSKLNGEIAIARECKRSLIIRTSGVFSPYQKNFVKTILQLAKTNTTLNIVNDQWICPTSAFDIAATLLKLAANQEGPDGLYHYCSTPVTNWYEFTLSIIAMAKQHGDDLKTQHVNAVATQTYPRPAKRPAYSALCCDKIRRDYAILPPQWHTSLAPVIGALIKSSREPA